LLKRNTTFQKICPVSKTSKKRYEDLELVLRFFAFLNNYKNFNHRVDEFLDEYVEANQNTFDNVAFKSEFERMIQFVDKHFEYGFRKTKTAKSTPRVRFEAISVGVGLALRENPDLIPATMEWINSDEFKVHTTTHASNSPIRVSGRIEYVRDMDKGVIKVVMTSNSSDGAAIQKHHTTKAQRKATAKGRSKSCRFVFRSSF
jgi:hypothetical protein